MYRRVLVPVLAPIARAWSAEGCLCMVREGELQIWTQMRSGARIAWSEHEYGPEKQEGRSVGIVGTGGQGEGWRAGREV